jgi:hypothetical protein
MPSPVWLKYLLGQRAAILEVARWRGSLWAGVALVLLTGIARNYDQTFITETPVLWLFGPLLFSFVSGSWLYFVLYGCFARLGMEKDDGTKPAFWSGWRSFMGLFWLTAPIAWLYAIPVERFSDSLTAAKLNLTLLAVVSLWRVLLMARVMQVITSAPLVMTLVWVLVAASVEIFLVYIFGGGVARGIMASMGGMRNSPEEEILFSALGAVSFVAFWTLPVSLIVALVWRSRRTLDAFPPSQSGPMPWWTLAALAVFWMAVAIVPQRELANSVAVERLLAEGKSRAALDYLVGHQPHDFAPARTLPPKPYEREIFDALPACFGAVLPSDPAWVRSHLMRRLDQMLVHYGPRRDAQASFPREEQIERVANSFQWHGPDAGGMLQLLDGLGRIPEGKAWLLANTVFLEAALAANKETPQSNRESKKTEAEQEADRLLLLKRLDQVTTELNPAGGTQPP